MENNHHTQVLKKVGQYRLIRKIGKGATAQVYEGRKESSYEQYAIKMMKLKNVSEAQREMITKEISIIKSINHPNIVKLIDTLETTNNYYLIFEFCEKGDLQKYLRKEYGALVPQETVQKIFFCIGDAIRQIHSKGIVHRDIKLANILLKRDGKIKLADFGFAKEVGSEESFMETYCGTPITMAPEILQSKPYNSKCDIWSLGIIMFQLVYGKLPFSISQGYHQFVDKVVTQNVSIPSQPQMPPEFKQLLCKCLEKKAEDRCDIVEFMNSKWISSVESNNLQVREERREKDNEELSTIFRKITSKQEEEELRDLEKIIAIRIYEQVQEEVNKILKMHLETRKQIVDMLSRQSPEEIEMVSLLYFLDRKYLQFLRKSKISLIKEAHEIPLALATIKDIIFPEPLMPAQQIESVPQISQTLLSYLKKHSHIETESIDIKKSHYQLIQKDMELMKRYDLSLTLVFAHQSHNPEVSLENIRGQIEKRQLDDPSEEELTDVYDLNANHVTISMECKQRCEKMKSYRDSMIKVCEKAIDELTKKSQGYYD